MASTPNLAPNKRTRFDPTANPNAQSSSSPMHHASLAVKNYCATLHNQISSILLSLSLDKFLKNKRLADSKHRQFRKMETADDYFPRSVKIDVKIHCSELSKKSPDYTAIDEEMKLVVAEFQQRAKETIIKATKLDAQVHQTAADKVLMEAIQQISMAFITLDDQPHAHVHQFAHTIIDRYHEDLCHLVSFSTKNEIIAAYQLYTDAPVALPAPFLAPAVLPRAINAVAPNVRNPYIPATPPAALPNLAPNDIRRTEPTIQKIWTAIRSCFIRPWATYIAIQDQNDKTLQLKKILATQQTTAATDVAQMLVDGEEAVTPAVINALIEQKVAQKVSAQLKTTQKEINELRNLVKNSKNETQRGRQGASTRKKKSPGTAQRPAKAGQKVDESDSDSSKNSRNKQKKTGKKSLPSKKPTSKTRNNKRSGRSKNSS
jgi:hypothetical protein